MDCFWDFKWLSLENRGWRIDVSFLGCVRDTPSLLRSVPRAGSIEEEEDQERVMNFLERHTNFVLESPEPQGAADPGMFPPTAPGSLERSGHRPQLPASVITSGGFVATLPHVHHTDGAFAARLRRLL